MQSHDTKVQQYFDRHKELYADVYIDNYDKICRYRIAELAKSLVTAHDRPIKLLDLGCATGHFMDVFVHQFHGATVVGMDLSLVMLRANRCEPRKHLLAGDANLLPFKPNSFDIVNVDVLMHHLIVRSGYQQTIGNIIHFLRNTKELLKSNGLLAVREICHESYFLNNFGAYLMYQVTTLHLPRRVVQKLRSMGLNTADVGVCFLTRSQWRSVFDQAGFEICDFTEFWWPGNPYRRWGFSKSLDIFVHARRK